MQTNFLAKNPCRVALWVVARFGLCVVFLSLVLSLLILPWIKLPWWTVVRRCVSIAAALSLWIVIRRVEHRSFRSYGFSRQREGMRHVLQGWSLGLIVLLLMFGVGLWAGICRIEVSPDRLRLWRTVIGFLPVVFLISLLEELVFRGLILQQLCQCSKTLGVLGSSFFYSLVHVRDRSLELSSWLEFGGLFLLGIVLALSYLKTKQLYFPVGLHAVLAYAARVNKLLIKFSDPVLLWLVGTNRLVNGLVGWIALVGIGLWVWGRASPITTGGTR